MGGLRVPKDLRDITLVWLTEALQSRGAAGGASVTGYSAETLAEGKGFMNRLFRVTLDYDADLPNLPAAMIVKLPSADPLLRAVFDRLGQNRREVRFYQELAVNPHLPAPGCYHSGVDPSTGHTVLLLEDMSHARQGDSVAGCSMAEARAAIVQLARFQASWWESSRLDGLHWMPLKDAEAGSYQEIYPGAWKSLIEKAGDGMPPGLRRLGDRLSLEVPRIKALLTKSPRTIVHGDYRLDNCFFSNDAHPQPLVVFDWEFCVRGRGACDVATFISEAFPSRQRGEVELDLLRTYHTVLLDNGVSGYSFEECWHDYRLSMLEIFVFWIITGGYCNFESERATVYLHNTLARFDAAISDLAATELLSN
ncbi:hypothetical protein GBAR_LOCUS15636 [Geodia barretti]|uniref:CHK kinase-like domain-containing protein n=1 Tax=Geodia barretti TaxID=519541 RepID=A0AA35SEW0_GEOBA|nr:hypothetical protein GBAR_LOCUS15636 [Geodia barretti]